MSVQLKQVSSLEKIMQNSVVNPREINKKMLMGGECFSYQLVIETSDSTDYEIGVESPLKDNICIYLVKNAIADLPCYSDRPCFDEDYITKKPALIPDILIPYENERKHIRTAHGSYAVWVKVSLPENTPPGEYPITISFCPSNPEEEMLSSTMTIEAINTNIPPQGTIFTQWFHTDCIASVHNVEIYSEEHWDLIEKYIHLAVELGINMLLTPVITPPLDTEVGARRPCTQLVRIEKSGDDYTFDFTLLERWVSVCLAKGIKYFEIAHLFTQWGLECAPNIKVWENEKEDFLFGWHTDARSELYKSFLDSFLPALIAFFDEKGLKDRIRFHISDEPSLAHIEQYRYAKSIVAPLLGDCPICDAISNYEFFETGLIENPVVATNHISPFIENKVKSMWAYYCCAQFEYVGNRFLAMPSYRNRILGLQLYKYNIQGFLQWGYNFYYSQRSLMEINPYITTSGDKSFPSGDSFSVYPVKNGVVPSLRGIIFKEALNDIEICRTLEGFIGREKVIEMIDEAAGMTLTFSEYPRNPEYIPDLIEKMEQLIKDFVK